MSVYLPCDKEGNAKTKFFAYDFRLKPKGATKSQRFFGSTSQATLTAAKRVEQRLRELAKLGQLSHSMTVAEACQKYWDQKMSRVRSAIDQATNLEVISTFIGPETLVIDITPGMVSDAAARRSKTPVRKFNRRTKKVELTRRFPTPATVNRQLVQPLRRFLRYCRKTLQIPIDLSEFEWSDLRYQEADERNREMAAGEEIRYWQGLRQAFHPIVELYLLSGRRRSDWVEITKDKVNIEDRTVRVPSRKKKRQGELVIPLTDAELQIIRSEMEKSPADCPRVFTYECQKGDGKRGKRIKGKRYPITATGLRRAHATACKAAGITDFRIHDYRHTMASRLMRSSGNPKLVMRALDHSSLASTGRYLHVLEKDVKEAREKVTTYRSSPGVVILRPPKNASNR